MAGEAWLDHLPIPRAQIHEIPNRPRADIAADAYAQTLSSVEVFDLTLLGLGKVGTRQPLPRATNGEWAGFPRYAGGIQRAHTGTQRISLSAARLNRSRQIIFLVSGESKRQAVARWRAGEHIPATAITGESGVDVLVESSLLYSRRTGKPENSGK